MLGYTCHLSQPQDCPQVLTSHTHAATLQRSKNDGGAMLGMHSVS